MFICNVLFYISFFFCVRPQKLVSNEELNIYLDAVKRVSEFYKQNVKLINMNILFTLFITNVNFKHILDNYKDVSNSAEIKAIFENNENSMIAFKKTENETLSKLHHKIPTLFANITPWVIYLSNFTYTPRRWKIEPEVRSVMFKVRTYKKAVKEFEYASPNPTLSNKCLAFLADYPINIDERIFACPLKRVCNEALRNGSSFGYALTHQILWLVVARYSRGCTIVPLQEDKELLNKFCGMAYTEILIIQYNYIDHGDLIYEFICICSLGGHAEFLHKNWLNFTLTLQTNLGCFQRPLNLGTGPVSGAVKTCDHHSTSVIACSLSVAIRYILEK